MLKELQKKQQKGLKRCFNCSEDLFLYFLQVALESDENLSKILLFG